MGSMTEFMEGDIFTEAEAAVKAMAGKGRAGEAGLMQQEILASGSYAEASGIITRYLSGEAA